MYAPAQVLLALGVLWNAVRPGVWRADVPMASDGPLAAVHAIVIRLDPSQLRFDFATGEPGQRWTIDRMPAESVVALNTGQFRGPWPWGWVVEDGIEAQPPGMGSVVMSFVVDRSGHASLVTPNELPAVRGHVQLAFQSYPALLVGNAQQPWELQAADRGVDLTHRDSRLAMGTLDDGSVVIALTRVSALGPAEMLPYGPTVPEMAAFMKSLGCQRAMLLDGGISSQLAFRNTDGEVKRWKNWRAVPLGLVVTPISPTR